MHYVDLVNDKPIQMLSQEVSVMENRNSCIIAHHFQVVGQIACPKYLDSSNTLQVLCVEKPFQFDTWCSDSVCVKMCLDEAAYTFIFPR